MRRTQALTLAMLALFAAPLLFSGCQSSGGNPPATTATQDALIQLAATAACDSLTHGHPERIPRATADLDAAEKVLNSGASYAVIEEVLLRSIKGDKRALAYVDGALVLLRAQFPNQVLVVKVNSSDWAHVQAAIAGCRSGLLAND